MNKFKNTTKYLNFLSDKLNSTEEFFTQMVVDFLNDVPNNYDEIVGRDLNSLRFKIEDNHHFSAEKSFELDNEKWDGVTVEIRLRYFNEVDADSFCEWCDVRIWMLKQSWWDLTFFEDKASYQFGDFPTYLLPDKIIKMFEPVFSMPAHFERIVSLTEYINVLKYEADLEEENTTILELIAAAESKLMNLNRITNNFPIERYLEKTNQNNLK